MSSVSSWLRRRPVFDSEAGVVVAEPVGEGEGYWAGAPGAYYDDCEGRFYLSYRLRRPRGVEPERGGEARIAVSEDGVHFEDIWRIEKGQLDTPSLERSSLTRAPDGEFIFYMSYVDPADHRWRIDCFSAPSVTELDPASRRKVFTAADVGIEGIKDPYIVRHGACYFMIVSYAELASPDTDAAGIHDTADAYDSGRILSHSGLAISGDGYRFRWLGRILEADGSGWDGYSARIGSVVYQAPLYWAFYDGAGGVHDHYDERIGLAVSHDLRDFQSLTPDGPALSAPHGTRCLRYMDALPAGDNIHFYYEYARPDGSHELRANIVPRWDGGTA